MTTLISAAGVVTGAICECAARHSSHSVAFEIVDGILLIGGLALLGAFLPDIGLI